jgi:hypothetical protein
MWWIHMKQSKRKKDNKSLGRFRIWMVRVGSYLAPVNFLLILYNFAKNEPLGITFWFWMIFSIICVFGLIIFDTLFMFSSELHYSYMKNPGMQILEEKVNVIIETQHKIIDEMNKK